MSPRPELPPSVSNPQRLSSLPADTSTANAISAREGLLEIPGGLSLFHGGRLASACIAWRLAGPGDAPVLVALGGISAHRRVYSTDDATRGWWDEVVGNRQALPADRFRILSFDYLGGSGETSGPCADERFPSISSYDQADALLFLLNHLGLKSLRAIVGASYGGMVALAFAERYPERVSQLVLISASDRTHPMATAWRTIQRRMVRFAMEAGRPAEGLKLARALAMTTYRSPEEFSARFSGAPRQTSQGYVFPVEEYLIARGEHYAARHRPEAFLCLSESIDLHRVNAARVFTPTTAIAVTEDQLVPIADMRAMCARLPHAKLHEISSVYGHDAFLKEAERLKELFAKALGVAA